MKKLYFIIFLLVTINTYAQSTDRFDFTGHRYKTFLDSILETFTTNTKNNYFGTLLTSLKAPEISKEGQNKNVYNKDEALKNFFNVDQTEDIPVEKIKEFQQNAGIKVDGIVGPQTENIIDNYLDNNKKYTDKLSSVEESKTIQGDKEFIGGNEKGDVLGFNKLSNFCTDKNGGNSEGSDFWSCGSQIGNCSQLPKKLPEYASKVTLDSCKTCPDCNFIKSSCGTPLYFYKGNDKRNSIKEANKPLCALALKRSKLREIFGSDKPKDYCGKKISICSKNGKCGSFPVYDTGLDFDNRIDATGCVDRILEISDKGLNTIISYREKEKNTQQTASLEK